MYVTTHPKYTEEATTKIIDIDINKYKTHDVINSLHELCGKIQLWQSYQMQRKVCRMTLEVAGNAHTLNSGIEINGEEFNCNF